MKKLWIKSTACVIALSVSLMASGPRVTGAMLSSVHNEIVAVDTAALYTNQSPTGGMIFEIISAALKSENESASLSTYPIQKMVNYYLTQENILAALGTHFNLSASEKKKLIAIPVSVIQEQYIYYKPSHPKGIAWGGKLSNLKGLRYGRNDDEEIKEYTKAGIKVLNGNMRSLFDKLKAGSADFVGAPKLSVQDMMNSNFRADKDQFAVMEPEPAESICTIVFNLKNPEAKRISTKLRKGLLTILKNGQYQAIVEKYEGKTAQSSNRMDKLKSLLAREAQSR